MRGKVLWFDSNKGYGFVKAEDGRELYFHHTNISMEGYRCVYSGTPVEIFMGENNENIKCIVPLERVSPSGKPILLVAFLVIIEGQSDTLIHFNFDVARKAESGIKYITSFPEVIFCTDKPLSKEEKFTIRDIILTNYNNILYNKPICTDLRYDIMFI